MHECFLARVNELHGKAEAYQAHFKDDWTLEDMLRARGDSVETLDDDNLAEGVDAELLKRLVEGRRDK